VASLVFLGYLVCAQILLVVLFTARLISGRGLVVALPLLMLGGFLVFVFMLLRVMRKRVAQSFDNPAAPSRRGDSMAIHTFENVWYSPRKRWYDWHLLAYRDVGRLTIEEKSLEFQGRRQTLLVETVLCVSYGKQGRDFVNNWVIVDYRDGVSTSTALFADGNMAGWSGVLGGTKRYATLYTGGSGGFVTSTAAPIATGWSDPVPGRVFPPAVDQCLFTAHCKCLLTTSIRLIG